MVERVEAVITNPVVGDMPVEVTYADYRDFGGVKFPMRIRQAAAASRRGTHGERREAQCARGDRGARQRPRGDHALRAGHQRMVADGVWYVTGGSHHSVVIEMRITRSSWRVR